MIGPLVLPIAFLLGVLIVDSGYGFGVLALALGGCAALLGLASSSRERIMVLLGAGLLLAGYTRAAPMTSPTVSPGVAQSLRAADAVVLGQPDRLSDHVRARLRLLPSGSTVEASLPVFPELSSGDRIHVRFPRRAEGDATAAVLFVTDFTVDGSDAGRAGRARNWLNHAVSRAILSDVPEPAGSLVLGVVSGDDSGMTPEVHDAFRRAGLTHITAVSGWNLSIVAATLALFYRGGSLPRLARLAIVLGAVWGFAFLVGMVPSVVRAAVMASLILIGRWRGRPADLTVTLLWAVVAIVAVTPAIRFDIGFQLSVVATLALALVVPYLVGRPAWQIALAVPAAAELAITPLTLHHFGSYSLLSPFSNLVVESLVGPVMAGGALVVAAHAIHPALAGAVGALTWLPARAIVLVAEVSTRWSGGSGVTGTLSWSATLLCYVVLLALWLTLTNWEHLARWLADPRPAHAV